MLRLQFDGRSDEIGCDAKGEELLKEYTVEKIFSKKIHCKLVILGFLSFHFMLAEVFCSAKMKKKRTKMN